MLRCARQKLQGIKEWVWTMGLNQVVVAFLTGSTAMYIAGCVYLSTSSEGNSNQYQGLQKYCME
jgi:hypothetical protein